MRSRERVEMWEIVEKEGQPLILYSGKLPSKLYRYRSVKQTTLEHLIDFEIKEEGIYLAGLKDLNDPDEGRFLVTFKGTREEIASWWKESLISVQGQSPREVERLAYERADEIIAAGGCVPRRVIDYTRYVVEHVLRVACFTTLPTNYSMWANYAKYLDEANPPLDHGGICIEYTCDESWRSVNLHPVVYSDEVPKINPVIMDESELVKAIYSKSYEWRCENEWRIFMHIQSMPPFSSNFSKNSKVKIEGGVSGIIFGLKTPEHVVDEISAKIRQTGRDISLRRVVRDPMTYERALSNVE